MISIHFNTRDGWDETFYYGHDESDDAFNHVYKYLGNTFDIGSSYAVNAWGDLTVTIDGTTWEDYMLWYEKNRVAP